MGLQACARCARCEGGGMSGIVIQAAARFTARRAHAAAEHKTRVAVGRNKPLPNADELRFAVECQRPCDSGE